jgi:hypothetical protein
LHHTVSSTMQSAWNWWNETEDHIATAFIIDKNGIIYRCFDEKYWAYHTGTGAHYDKHSIGIELVNEGSLIKDPTGDLMVNIYTKVLLILFLKLINLGVDIIILLIILINKFYQVKN